MSTLLLFNGRAYACRNPSDPRWESYNGGEVCAYVAARSRADARRVIAEYTGGRPPADAELRDYWSKGWGNPMQGVTPERGLWLQFGRSAKPVKVWPVDGSAKANQTPAPAAKVQTVSRRAGAPKQTVQQPKQPPAWGLYDPAGVLCEVWIGGTMDKNREDSLLAEAWDAIKPADFHAAGVPLPRAADEAKAKGYVVRSVAITPLVVL